MSSSAKVVTSSVTYGMLIYTLIQFGNIEGAIRGVGYSFSYSIDKPEFGLVTQHWEKGDGDGNHVHGGYSFLDADGKIRDVQYRVDDKKGFKAFVTFRRPPGQFVGHLKFPKHYRKPIRLVEPVSLITPDLFHPKERYPNIPR